MLQIVMAFAPLVFLILYALKTRKMADAMVLATLLAMVLLHRQHFLTGTIDAMYAAARQAGALGGKITGAGGGGFLLLYVERDRQPAVRRALARLLHVPFDLDHAGSQIIFSNPIPLETVP